MKFAIVALAAASAVSAQLVYNNQTNEFECRGEAADKNFCAGESLQTNIIIRCTGTKGQPGNCNDNLAGVPPIGVKSFAPCWQSSETAGDAACSFNNIVYGPDGKTFPVPGTESSSSSEPTYEPTTSSEPEPYPTDSTTVDTAEPSTSTTEEPTTYPPTDYPPYPTLTYANTTSVPTTLVTVTGTSTITTCLTTTKAPEPTNTYVPPPPPPPPAHNTTSTYTTGLPIPTQAPNGATSLIAKDGVVLGAVALIGFMFL